MKSVLERMDVIEDVSSAKKIITDCINKYGSAREHNYWFFYNQQTSYSKVYFFKFGDGGVNAIRYDSGTWEVIGDMLAPIEKRREFFESFLNYVFADKKNKKVFAFVNESFWNDISHVLQNSEDYRITNKPKVYYTPIFDMDTWHDRLDGKKWKKLRNIKNKFFSSNKVEIVSSDEIEKKKLIKLILEWRKKRPNRAEKTYYMQMYMNFVRNDFEGLDIMRSIVVNNEPCTLTAGWKIPNSSNYYSAIGLHNYKYSGLAEMANIDDLTQIKSKGYKYADFGDSTEPLLRFKKKFFPTSFYKTYWFYIIKK